jgi:hypothetical protein
MIGGTTGVLDRAGSMGVIVLELFSPAGSIFGGQVNGRCLSRRFEMGFLAVGFLDMAKVDLVPSQRHLDMGL